jgi:hypothetical protein
VLARACAGNISGVPDRLPLTALLSAAFVAFTIELDNEFEQRMPDHGTAARRARGEAGRGPYLVSVAMWASCVRYVTEEGITVREVERLARTHANLDGVRRWGYVTLDGAGRGGGARTSGPDSVLALTAAGRRANAVWAPLGAEIEARWRDRFGARAIDRLHAALRTAIGERQLALPDTLPILRYGLFCEVRDGGDAVDPELVLGSLLSRTLLALALGYERGVKLSLAVMLDVVRLLDGDGVRVTDLPRLSGVSKEAIAMALGLLEKNKCVETWSRDRRRYARLTDRGLNARRRGLRRVSDHEAAWRERFGDELRDALTPLVGDGTRGGSPLFAGLEPNPDGWRADVRPPDRLPWFPMVLHRGGWPDGS